MAATVNNDLLTFRPIKIGGGGWVTSHDQHSDGTLVARTDVGGGYLWNSGTSSWSQIVTTSTMPAGDVHQDYTAGIYEIAIAPSNSSTVYMHYMGYVYKSTDKCATWVKKTAITGDVHWGANAGVQRYYSNKMAVDPLDANIVYVGTLDNGLWRTTDGGTSWSKLTGVPDATGTDGQYDPGIHAILFDPTSGSSSTPTRTSIIWAFSYGNGYYRSTDGGTTWSKPASGPSTLTNACFATNGDLYAVNEGTDVYKFSGGSWTTSNCNFTPFIPACDPNNSSRVICFGGGGGSVETTNGGTSWGTPIQANAQTRTATDVPWLAWTNEGFMSAGRITFDKVTANKILFSEGIGFWTASLSSGFSSLAWTSMSKGIEELVAKKVYQPFGTRKIYCMSMDRDLFVIGNPDVYPTRHFLKVGTYAINHGSDVHSVQGDPSKMAALAWYGGYSSSDGGLTWTAFPSAPSHSGFNAGEWPQASQICMITDQIWLVSGGGGRGLNRTTNAGQSWSAITLPGSPPISDFSISYYEDRRIFAVDGVTNTTVYLWGYGGIYKSTDSGANWSQVYTGAILGSYYFHAKLRAVPGQAGHLFLSGGHVSTGDPISDYNEPKGSMFRSTDGGVTWVRCGAANDILEVYDFALGPTPAGQSYPVLWIMGWVNNTFGIYYCLNANVLDASTSGTWYKVSDGYPLGTLDRALTLDCDKSTDEWKRVFLGFAGNGYMYGSENAYSASSLPVTFRTT